VPLPGSEDASLFGGAPVEASLFWDLGLLVASLLAIGAGASLGIRGSAYVGAFGILFFVLVVGLDLDDSSPAGKLLGWPLIVLILGAAEFAASFVPSLRLDRVRPGASEPPPPPAPHAPPPPGQP
jgi:hypothetical protein